MRVRRRLRTNIRSAVLYATAIAAAGFGIWVFFGASAPPPAVPGAGPSVAASRPDADGLTLPKKIGSLRFAVMGDVGRGDPAQYETAAQMARWHERFDFNLVLMLGDNIYAEGTAEQYAARFERPYKALLDKGVTFQAALGNHDPPGQTAYPPFHMNGNRYYSFTKDAGPPLGNRTVQFFALDTVTLDRGQIGWLVSMLSASKADWKICFYHHPLYTSGRYSISAFRFRRQLEPLFVQYGVDVGWNGHEHFYERIVPQRGVQYFTSGGGGALRVGDIRSSRLTAAGFDRDTHFMLVEISGDRLYFQTISRTGETVDQGEFDRLQDADPPPVLRK